MKRMSTIFELYTQGKLYHFVYTNLLVYRTTGIIFSENYKALKSTTMLKTSSVHQ